MFRCSCGRTLYGDKKLVKAKGGTRRPHILYVHQCQAVGAKTSKRESELMTLIDSQVSSMRVGKHFEKNVSTIFNSTIQELRQLNFRSNMKAQNRLNNIDSDLSKLMDFLLQGRIDSDVVQAKISELKRERSGLLASMSSSWHTNLFWC